MSVKMPSGEFVDYYDLLGIDKLADAKQIRTSFLKLAKNHHPDAGGSTEYMQTLNKAYETLSGHLSRAAYDKLHALHTTPHEHLDLHDDYAGSPVHPAGDDAFVDDFVDDAYTQYYGKTTQAKKPSRIKKAIFTMFGVSVATGMVVVAGLTFYANLPSNEAVAVNKPPPTQPPTTTAPLTVSAPLEVTTKEIEFEEPITVTETTTDLETDQSNGNYSDNQDAEEPYGTEDTAEDVEDYLPHEFRRFFR